MKKEELLLEIKDLTTSFRIDGDYYAAVDKLNLHINKNEVFAIVGESGCGKSALAMSIVRLHNPIYTKLSGEINFEGRNLLDLGETQLNHVRGAGIGMIFQDPLSALNPLMRVGAQIEESLQYHTNLNKDEKKSRTIELLTQVGMVNPQLTYEQYPHELSGGMRQRAMIAIALSAQPSLLIADEPTTALDVTIQAQILDLLKQLKDELGSSIVIITHDLGVVAEIADRVAVMYAGQIVETASVYDILKNPQHPYTRSLLNAIPHHDDNDFNKPLYSIQGTVPTLKNMPRNGCRFATRVPELDKNTCEKEPTYHEISPDHKVLCSCYKHFSIERN